jgi:protein tyrosine phosphatase (PTP) superfamily phosphohydrolase (DUF442 family)
MMVAVVPADREHHRPQARRLAFRLSQDGATQRLLVLWPACEYNPLCPVQSTATAGSGKPITMPCFTHLARNKKATLMTSSQLSAIYNFLPLADGIGTAGQPTAEQLAAVKAAGYEVVINLATGTTPRDLPNEANVVAGLGLAYIHIPVMWDKPTTADLARFFDAMDANQDKQRFVHCIANMRVSAFVLLYRVLRQGVPLEEARAAMHRIWEPNATWQAFIDAVLTQERSPVARRERAPIAGDLLRVIDGVCARKSACQA